MTSSLNAGMRHSFGQMMLRFCPVLRTMYPEPKRGELGTKPVSMDKVLVIWAGVIVVLYTLSSS